MDNTHRVLFTDEQDRPYTMDVENATSKEQALLHVMRFKGMREAFFRKYKAVPDADNVSDFVECVHAL